MKKHRINVTNTLIKYGKYNKQTAIDIEQKIYKLDKSFDKYKINSLEALGFLLAVDGFIENTDDVSPSLPSLCSPWTHPLMKPYKEKYERGLLLFDLKPRSITGVYICKNKIWVNGKQQTCGSDQFWIYSMQTRSGDEGMTVYRQCAICNKRGKE